MTAGVFVFSMESMYIFSFPLVFVATLPFLPFLNEAGRVAASAPAVGGPGLIPAGFLSHFVFHLSLCYASGLLTAAGAVREGDEECGEVTGDADIHPPPHNRSTAE